MKLLLHLLILSTLSGCLNLKKGETKLQEKKWFFWSVDWHPTKNQIVAGGSNDSYLKVISTTTFEEHVSMPYLGTITKTKWHPTKNVIAVSVQDGKSKIAIVDLEKDTKIELDSVSNDGARAIGWNSTGNLLAVGDYDGDLTFFDENGQYLRKVDTKEKGLIGLDWHPTKDIVVAVGEQISIFNYTKNRIHQVEDRKEEVLMLCVAWHPNGNFFVTADYGDFVVHHPPLLQYWSSNGTKLKSIKESKAEYRNLEWSPDGQLLATASEKIRLWDKDGNLIDDESSENLLWGIAWSKTGKQLVTTDTQGKITFWDKNLKINKELEW